MEIYKFDIRIMILSISSTFLCVYFKLNMSISIIYAVIYKNNCSKNVVVNTNRWNSDFLISFNTFTIIVAVCRWPQETEPFLLVIVKIPIPQNGH